MPLHELVREVQQAHAQGRVDASTCLAAVERRVRAAERALLRVDSR